MKQITVLFLFCACLAISVPAAAQRKATYFLGGGATTFLTGKENRGEGFWGALNGIAVTAEGGVIINKNTAGLQCMLRLNDDAELIRDLSLVAGRYLVAEKRFSFSLHAGIGLQKYGITGTDYKNPEYAVFPVYADMRFGLSKNPQTNTSVWIGLRGGRYFSSFRPVTIGQVNLVIVAPWKR